jgi:C-terminal processing protease CtpA/Prc
VLSLSSCGEDYYDNTPDESLRISVDTIVVSNKEQAVTIGIVANNAAWIMAGSEDWCTVDPNSGETGTTQVTVTFTPYETGSTQSRTATLTFSSGGEEKNVYIEQLSVEHIPLPNENPDTPINQAIYERLGEWYYNGEPEDVLADYNQSYDDFYFNYLSNLNRNQNYEGNTWATGNERYAYSYVEKNPKGTADAAGSTPILNFGMEFDLGNFGGRMVGRILYVEKGSPAAAAGLKRGDWFYKVGYNDNNVQLDGGPIEDDLRYPYYYNRYIDTLVHPSPNGNVKLGMLSYRAAPAPGTLVDEGRIVTITPALYPNNPILHTQVIADRRSEESDITGYTGYMMYNSFDPAYENELIEAFEDLKEQNGGDEIDKFILDLRYNKSGTVEMAQLMGDLLVGDAPGVADQTFASYEFNDRSAAHDYVKTFAPNPSGVGVDTVFVLTSPHTAGASELLINALKGLNQNLVKLVMVGSNTQGMAVGMVKQTLPDPDPDSGWEYSAWMLAFRCYNAAGDGDYQFGFINNGGNIDEWDNANVKWSDAWGWKGRAGSTEDPIMMRVMEIVTGLEPYPAGNVIANSQPIRRTGFPREFCFPTNMTMDVE